MFTLAAVVGRVIPRTTPHAIVCRQFPNSQSPMMGRVMDVRCSISESLVNIRVHDVVNIKADKPIRHAKNIDTEAVIRPLSGWFAPSSFPTRVKTSNPSDDGKTYKNAVVCISTPIDATVAFESTKSPHITI
ncbi:hypothetical protein CTI12_AA491150 [Artemisia annua]|uniref:Uncharacterized protein n=1 Tax=Artemisia annua TaxID=35608 RepID=A0A2U1L5S5_ARTAN|nr:hypothetical protein CTI12_AA491150 [Artemisia annua]